MKLIAHPRMPFCAPPGKIIIECDYSSQEVVFGAALSGDPIMVESFLAPETLTDENGNPYKNHRGDFHTMTTLTCIAPDWFEGIPESQIVKRAKEVPPGAKRSYRDDGKTLGFAQLYLSTPQSIAERNHISVELAKQWDERYKKTYKGYFDWARNVADVARARGFAVNSRGRWRFVDEANSKGSGESLERNAVNFFIQSISADCTKEADLECRKEFRGTDVKCLLAVHDALVFEAPGTAVINWDESKCVDNVWTKLKFVVNDEAKEIADRIIQIMQDVETAMLEDLGSPIKGRAEAGISPYWNH